MAIEMRKLLGRLRGPFPCMVSVLTVMLVWVIGIFLGSSQPWLLWVGGSLFLAIAVVLLWAILDEENQEARKLEELEAEHAGRSRAAARVADQVIDVPADRVLH